MHIKENKLKVDLYAIRNELMSGKSIYDLEIKVTFYTRVSTSATEQLNSLKNQIQYYQEFIQNNPKWIYIEGYIDEGLTGTSTNKRDAFNRMIEDGRNKKFDLILTKEVSRFARNTLDSLFYTRELLKHGVGVFFQNDNINTLFPDSELRLAIMSSIAQEESRKLSDRVKWGHKRAVNNGRVLGNSAIWGYKKDNGKLVVVEKEAKVIREIFNLYVQGYGIRTVSQKLLEKGYVNSNGNPFTFSSIKYILTNPKYKGYYVGNKTSTIDYMTRKRVFFDEDKWVMYKDEEAVPPIVSEEVWDKANIILKKRSKKMSSEDKTSYQNKYLYSGKIICATHNTTFWRNLYKYDTVEDKEIWQCKVYRKAGRYACTTPALYKSELDHILKNVLHELFNNQKGLLDKLYNMIKETINEVNYDKDIKELMKKVELIEKRKNKLLDLNINEDISNDEFKSRNDKFNDELKVIQEQIKKYEELNDTKYDYEKQLKLIKQFLNKKYDFINNFDEDIAEQFLDKIIVYNTDRKNIISLKVILKSGIEISCFMLPPYNRSLLQPIHMNSNKRTFTFTRNNDSITNKPYEITFNISTEFKLIS